MTSSEQPHPQRCETCESFHEKEQSSRYRCSWIYCDVYPKDECPCSPSHWKEASHSSATEPAPERRSIDIAEMLAAVEQARKEERERVIQQFIDFGMSGKCVKTDKAEAVSCDAICERDCFVCFAESLRGGAP